MVLPKVPQLASGRVGPGPESHAACFPVNSPVISSFALIALFLSPLSLSHFTLVKIAPSIGCINCLTVRAEKEGGFVRGCNYNRVFGFVENLPLEAVLETPPPAL